MRVVQGLTELGEKTELAMRNLMNRAEIEAVFANMDLPLIERSIEEIQSAKERFGNPNTPSESGTVVHRLIVSNGTGKLTQDNKNNAELERRTL